MFNSFFPKPKWFLISLILWTLFNVVLWYSGGNRFGEYFGLSEWYASAELPIGLSRLWAPALLWFYLWFILAGLIFWGFWKTISDHKWLNWSILGGAFILFNIWFSVQITVAVNAWYVPFWDLIQNMLTNKGGDIALLYQQTLVFLGLAMVSVTLAVINAFFTSHWIFRWRTAMNEYYVLHWEQLRQIEGASQRVQEDTMRFATIMEDLGISLIKAIMTLLAFLPILFHLSKYVPVLPLIGPIEHSLVWASIVWAIFGTVLLMGVGIKLPGLEFNNQKVEAAYRKELVYGEDHADRAQPLTLKEIFSSVRKNYYRLYFHYAYFNMFATWYAQLDIIFGLLVLYPSIAGGLLTLGLINQIGGIFDKVRESFQYLITSWKTIIEMLSIYKRLKAFEMILK